MGSAAAGRPRIISLLALALVPLLFHLAIVEANRLPFSPSLGLIFRGSFVTVSALANWAIYGGLLVTFAVTLRRGREALITGMARRLHGTISNELATYTRRVTCAWCGFFAFQLTTSVTLFLFAPVVVWSFFVNVLDLPLVATMFACEYICRRFCVQDPPRHSLAAMLDMITDIRKPRAEWANSP